MNKDIINTNVFEHAGRVFAVAENSLPHEIFIDSLDTGDTWDIGGEWDRPAFTAHPKVWTTAQAKRMSWQASVIEAPIGIREWEYTYYRSNGTTVSVALAPAISKFILIDKKKQDSDTAVVIAGKYFNTNCCSSFSNDKDTCCSLV